MAEKVSEKAMILKKFKNTHGFSFLEIVVAMTMLTIVAASLMMASSYGRRNQIRNNDRVSAMAILEREMNQLRAQGANNLTAGVTTRMTTKDYDGLVGKLGKVVMAGSVPEEKYVRVTLTWGSKKESLAAFIFQE